MPSAGWPATDAPADAAPPAFVVPADLKLSRPARDVVKMAASGVPDDVIKAYIDNAPSAFNLSADNIIHMQGVGVSGAVTSEMLGHDKKLTDQAAMTPPGRFGFAQKPRLFCVPISWLDFCASCGP